MGFMTERTLNVKADLNINTKPSQRISRPASVEEIWETSRELRSNRPELVYHQSPVGIYPLRKGVSTGNIPNIFQTAVHFPSAPGPEELAKFPPPSFTPLELRGQLKKKIAKYF